MAKASGFGEFEFEEREAWVCYLEGQQAYISEKSYADNPCVTKSRCWDYWNAGWIKSQDRFNEHLIKRVGFGSQEYDEVLADQEMFERLKGANGA